MSREEDHVVDALCKLAKQMNIKCVVQVGAQDGYECNAVRIATGARAVAIEGNRECSPYSKDLEWHNLVIGSTNGPTKFYIHPDPDLSGKLARGSRGERQVEVQQQRLDSFCAKNGSVPDMLIIDTEGTTLEVLEGAEKILNSVRLIYAECQIKRIRPGVSLLNKVDSFLTGRGFRLHPSEPTYAVEVQGNYTWVKEAMRNHPFHESLIPMLVEGMGAKTYLELGTRGNDTIGKVRCKVRIGVDTNPQPCEGVRFFKMTTEEFILNHAAAHAPFDMVYIDADHGYSAVKSDYLGIFPHVSPEGLIFLHDTNPETKADTAPDICSDSWKFAKEITESGQECVTLPYHPGLTIVRKRTKWGPK